MTIKNLIEMLHNIYDNTALYSDTEGWGTENIFDTEKENTGKNSFVYSPYYYTAPAEETENTYSSINENNIMNVPENTVYNSEEDMSYSNVSTVAEDTVNRMEIGDTLDYSKLNVIYGDTLDYSKLNILYGDTAENTINSSMENIYQNELPKVYNAIYNVLSDSIAENTEDNVNNYAYSTNREGSHINSTNTGYAISNTYKGSDKKDYSYIRRFADSRISNSYASNVNINMGGITQNITEGNCQNVMDMLTESLMRGLSCRGAGVY